MQIDPAAELTGNDYVSIPAIDASGAIAGINVLHAGLAGLVEWAGDGADTPLFRPAITIGGRPAPLTELRWRRLDRWIPTFTATLPDDVAITGTICAPAGYPSARGFLFRLDLEHGGRAPLDVTVSLEIGWAWSRHWIATGRPLPGPNVMAVDRAGVLTLESDGGRGPALGIVAGPNAVLHGIAAGALQTATNGEAARVRIEERLTLTPRRRASACFFIGAGREADGARAAARALRRTGPDAWLRQARLELSHTLRAGQDHRWGDMLNRNLLFNRYFGVGRSIDTDQLVLLRSRSTRCPAPALFNEHEALLWTLPALIIADPGLAREALFRCLDTFSERSGEYLRYIDGGAFDPGFVLDQFLLYAWAIDHYVTATQDASVLDEPVVQQVIAETDGALYMRLHPEHLLCGTELLPSGDAADHPYTTTANALLRAFADALPRLWARNGGNDEPPPRFDGMAAEIAATVWQHCVTSIDGEHILVSSANLEGDVAVYDDPEASLALLPFFGFCPADDPAWTATMEFLRSRKYPLWRDGAVPGIAHRGDPGRARLAALVADLLGPLPDDALGRLLRLRLPDGIAAAAYDPGTGIGAEPHHAPLAGFLAWALIRAAEPARPARAARKPRR
jgi:uncharacterized protein